MQIPSLRAVMDTVQYERERALLEKAYGDPEAGNEVLVAKRDQAFAALFYSSGWTQEQLAEREGKSQSWVGYRLCFGRFLSYSAITTAVVKGEKKPLTEWRFRSFWERTEKALDEGARFGMVVHMMQDIARADPMTPSPKERKPSPQLQKAKDVVRSIVTAGGTVPRFALAESLGVCPSTIQRARAFEDGRLEGLRENLDERAIDASVLSKTSQAKLDAHKKRFEDSLEATFAARVQAETKRHIDEHLMPFYGDRLADADLLMKIGKPFTNKEYLSILRALHPDSSSVENRHDAFLLVKLRQVVLRPDERDRPLSSGLPTSLAELIARKDAIKAMAKAARAARPASS